MGGFYAMKRLSIPIINSVANNKKTEARMTIGLQATARGMVVFLGLALGAAQCLFDFYPRSFRQRIPAFASVK
jgi:hypothetical protein